MRRWLKPRLSPPTLPSLNTGSARRTQVGSIQTITRPCRNAYVRNQVLSGSEIPFPQESNGGTKRVEITSMKIVSLEQYRGRNPKRKALDAIVVQPSQAVFEAQNWAQSSTEGRRPVRN